MERSSLCADRYEDAAGSLRTDRTFDHVASIRRLKLDTFVAALAAVRVILVIDRNLRNFGLCRGRVRCRREDAGGGVLEQRAPKNSHRRATWCTGPCRNLACEILMATGRCSETYDARGSGLFPELMARSSQAVSLGRRWDQGSLMLTRLLPDKRAVRVSARSAGRFIVRQPGRPVTGDNMARAKLFSRHSSLANHGTAFSVRDRSRCRARAG